MAAFDFALFRIKVRCTVCEPVFFFDRRSHGHIYFIVLVAISFASSVNVSADLKLKQHSLSATEELGVELVEKWFQ